MKMLPCWYMSSSVVNGEKKGYRVKKVSGNEEEKVLWYYSSNRFSK